MTGRLPLHALYALAVLIAATGCGDFGVPESQVEVALSVGDVDAFKRDLQPSLGIRCGSLDCHGNSGRALRLYAERGRRMSADLRGKEATKDEIAANVRAFSGIWVVGESVDKHLALRKPLAVEAGGIGHVGPAIWDAKDDAGYACLKAWLLGESDAQAAQQACQEDATAAQALLQKP